MVVAELPRGFAGSHYVGSNRNGQAEGEPGRRCRSIQVEGMSEAVPVICGRDARAPRVLTPPCRIFSPSVSFLVALHGPVHAFSAPLESLRG